MYDSGVSRLTRRVAFVRSLALWGVVAFTASAAQAAQPTLTATAFRAEATAICVRLNDYSPPSTGTLASKMTALLKEVQGTATAIAKLAPPPSLAKLHAQLIPLEARDLTFFKGLLARLRAGKLSAAGFLVGFAAAPSGLDEDRLWKRMGVPACAQS